MNRQPALIFLDRLEYGAIAAFFGFLIGGLVALGIWCYVGYFLHHVQPFNTGLVEFSVAYFFLMGVVRGADAAETIVVGLIAGFGAMLVFVALDSGGGGIGSSANKTPFAWQSSMWWSLLYFVAAGLIAWRA